MTPTQLSPVLHRGVREGLTRVKYLRLIFIILILGWPIFGIVAFESGISFGLTAMWVFGAMAVWLTLLFTRCPRCQGYFYPRVTFFILPAIGMFRRRCSECGLDIRQLKRSA